MDDKLSNRLVEFRNKKGWNQDELASKLDVSRQSISNWENGSSTPSIEFIKKLAALYEVSIDDLLDTDKPIEDCYKKENKCKNNHVKINKDGIKVDDKDNSIDIEWDKEWGAKIKDCVDSEIIDQEIVIDDKDIKKKKKALYKSIEGTINLVLLCISIITYLILGFLLKDGWKNYWVLIIFSFIPGEIFSSIANRKPSSFPIIFISLGIYLTLGTFLNLWHPYWIILFSIPLYYMILSSIKSIIRNFKKSKE